MTQGDVMNEVTIMMIEGCRSIKDDPLSVSYQLAASDAMGSNRSSIWAGQPPKANTFGIPLPEWKGKDNHTNAAHQFYDLIKNVIYVSLYLMMNTSVYKEKQRIQEELYSHLALDGHSRNPQSDWLQHWQPGKLKLTHRIRQSYLPCWWCPDLPFVSGML